MRVETTTPSSTMKIVTKQGRGCCHLRSSYSPPCKPSSSASCGSARQRVFSAACGAPVCCAPLLSLVRLLVCAWFPSRVCSGVAVAVRAVCCASFGAVHTFNLLGSGPGALSSDDVIKSCWRAGARLRRRTNVSQTMEAGLRPRAPSCLARDTEDSVMASTRL
jgi:hypothetical protein